MKDLCEFDDPCAGRGGLAGFPASECGDRDTESLGGVDLCETCFLTKDTDIALY